MERKRTLGEYRTIDLVIFAVLLTFFEWLVMKARVEWFSDELYFVSLAAPIVSIVYMRWGAWGIPHAVLAGFVFCLFSGTATGEQYIIYCVGNAFSALALLLLFKVGKEKVRAGRLSLVFPILVQFLMHGGRALTALVLGNPLAVVMGFFVTDSLSYVFTLVIIWIARRLDGVYEDQKHYLIRINTPEKE